MVLFCSTLCRLIFIKNRLTSYWQIILLPQSYLLFCKTRLRAQNAILVIPFNNVFRIKDTAITLLLPTFWQFCSLSATFIFNSRGIVKSQAYNCLKFYFFLPFLSITFNKYPKFEVSKSRILWILHNVCKQKDLNNVSWRGPSRRLATLAVCYDVADRRRWQWKS